MLKLIKYSFLITLCLLASCNPTPQHSHKAIAHQKTNHQKEGSASQAKQEQTKKTYKHSTRFQFY